MGGFAPTNPVQWSRRVQSVYTLQDKAGMVLRGRIRLDACTLPPSVNDIMAGTGCYQDGLFSLTNKEHLNEAPLNGVQPTSLERVVMSTSRYNSLILEPKMRNC